MPAWSGSVESSVPGLQTAAFLLHVPAERKQDLDLVSLPIRKDVILLDQDPTLMTSFNFTSTKPLPPNMSH